MKNHDIRMYSGQDGLQVAHNDAEILQPVHGNIGMEHSDGLIYHSQKSNVHGTPNAQFTRGKKGLGGINLWLVGAVILLATGLAVTGGVLGTRNSHDSCTTNASLLTSTAGISTASFSNAGSSISTSIATGTSQTSSSTVVSELSLPTAGLLPSNCTGTDIFNGTATVDLVTASSANVTKFITTCNQDFDGNNFALMTTYTLWDCLSACSYYNLQTGSNGCLAIAWIANVTTGIIRRGGNCYLKNSTSEHPLVHPPNTGWNAAESGPLTGAILIDD